jgi:hypothetical protein
MTTYRVELPPGRRGAGVVCGIVTNDLGQVTDAAPVMGWAVGLDIELVKVWTHRQGGSVERLGELTPMVYSGGKLRRIGRG